MTLYTREDYLRICEDLGIDPDAPPEEETEVSSSPGERLSGKYVMMDQADNYAKGVAALRTACANDPDCHPRHIFKKDSGRIIYRPLTFKENIEARVENFNTLNNPDGTARSNAERRHLLFHWNDTCTGISYKERSTKFKIITSCEQLINIDGDYKKPFIRVDYDSLLGIELDTTGALYRTHLPKALVFEHPAWLAVVEDDRILLNEYVEIIFNLGEQGGMMACRIVDKDHRGMLRAMYVGGHSSNLNVGGELSLNFRNCFMRAQKDT